MPQPTDPARFRGPVHHLNRMPIHLAKGLTLAAALLAPVATTLFFHWRTLVVARRDGQVR